MVLGEKRERRARLDFTKYFPCPECGEPLHGMYDNSGTRVRWVCRRAIGELAYHSEWRRQYFPEGSIHRGHLKWFEEEGESGTIHPVGYTTTGIKNVDNFD